MSTYLFSFLNHKVTLNVLIESEAEVHYSATVLGLPDCKAEGETREQALTRLYDCVSTRLAQAEIFSMEIKPNDSPNPWLKLAGKYKDDPQFDEVLEYIAAYRRELDAEMEADDKELDGEHEAK